MRSELDVVRGAGLALFVDGRRIEAFEGETLAVAMLAADARAFRVDGRGRPRGLFCNMGVCSECLVDVSSEGLPARRLRACMIPVVAGMIVATGAGT